MSLFNLARMTVSSTGTGTVTLNVAVPGYLTFDLAGCSTVASGQLVTYAIADTVQSEIGIGTYRSSNLTLTRASSAGLFLKTTNSNSPINMTNAAQVMITAASWDFGASGSTATILTSTAAGLTYTPPTGTTRLEIMGVGGGQGGQGASSGATPSAAGTTIFDGSLSATGGNGGSGGIGTGGNILNLLGGDGEERLLLTVTGANSRGASGGASYFGPGGVGSNGGTFTGSSGQIGSGGGGGGTGNSSAYGGGGGGAGGFFWHTISISSLSSALSYSYSIGAGTDGSSRGAIAVGTGSSGSGGANGRIIVKEFY